MSESTPFPKWIVLFILTSLAPMAGATEEEHRTPSISLADVGHLSCQQLQDFSTTYGRQFRAVRAIQKKAQDRRFADREQLERLGHELENETLEVAKNMFTKFKSLKEAAEATVASREALDRVLALEAAMEAAETSAAKLRAIKG